MPQEAEVQESIKGALTAFENLKSEFTDVKGKMKSIEGFDEAKFKKMADDIAKGIEASQKAEGLAKDAELKAKDAELKAAKFEEKYGTLEEKQRLLEAAFNRPVTVTTGEDKTQEVRQKTKKLFNDFARLEDDGQKVYFDSFARKNLKADDLEMKALTVNSDPSGGYLTTPELGGIVQTYIYETSPIRQLASVMEIGTDTYEVLLDNDQAGYGWVGETQARPDTTTPILRKLDIKVNEMYAMPNASQKLLDDASIDVEKWLAEKVSQVFARAEATAFISGDGVVKPKGILSYAGGTDITQQQIAQVPSGSASGFTYAGFVALQAALKEEYQGNATFLVQRISIANILTIEDGQGRPIFNMTFDKNTGLATGIMGRPLRFANDVPAVATNAQAAIYGDFRRGYQIVDRQGIRVLRDPFTNKPFVRFYTTKRVGGGVVNFEALAVQVIHT